MILFERGEYCSINITLSHKILLIMIHNIIINKQIMHVKWLASEVIENINRKLQLSSLTRVSSYSIAEFVRRLAITLFSCSRPMRHCSVERPWIMDRKGQKFIISILKIDIASIQNLLGADRLTRILFGSSLSARSFYLSTKSLLISHQTAQKTSILII